MDDQALISTYGNTNMPDGTEDRPLVTFGLFAYNQEKYIGAAIKGALSQTYSPLEIILSDDCSSDRTFYIMQEMAAVYEGPHKIKVRKSKANVGTLAHIHEVIPQTTGKLIILAAGDDISRRDRAEKLFRSWKASGSWAVHSNFSIIDHNGSMIQRNRDNDNISSPSYRLRSYMSGSVKEKNIVHGATSGYDRSLFQYLILPEDKFILSEDGALSILIHILGKDVSYVAEPLVEYRQHDASLTNSTGRRLSGKELSTAEKNISKFARSQANRCQFIIESHQRLNLSTDDKIDVELVKKDLITQRLAATWWDMRLLDKLSAVLKADIAFAKWAIPRLLPRGAFITIKYLRELLRAT